MSLRNPNGGPRPMNPPPADAFSYRPVQQQQQQQQQPQPQQGQPGQGSGQPPALGQQQPQHLQQQQPPQAQQQQVGFTKPPPLSLEQSKAVARTHYTALKGWLTNEGALSSGSTRTNARDKLTRLTRQQFQELSTDVYDELMRRIDDSATPTAGQQPFLAVRPDFHPKRNQARQKLATLPLSRFRDLASDVYFELDRRYPEFGEEDENAGGQAYSTPQTHFSPHSRTGSHASSQQAAALTSPPPPTNLNARRAPTPTSSTSQSSALPVGNDVVVPNKSTMLVEDEPMRSPPAGAAQSLTSPTSATSPPIPSPTGSLHAPRSPSPGSAAQARPNGGPYGFGASHSASSLPRPAPPVPTVREEDEREDAYGDERGEALSSPPAARALYGQGSAAGSGSGQGLGQQQGLAQGAGLGLGNSRASEVSSNGTSSRFFGGYAGSNAPSEVGGGNSGRRSWENEAAADKVRAEYEYKLARLQNRVVELERDGASAASASASSGEGERRVREQLEDERRRWEQRFEEQQAQLRSLQRDHDSLRARGPSPSSSSTRSAGTSGLDAQVRARLHEAEELAAEMRGEVSSLVDEVRHVNERAEELQREVEREREARERAEKEAREWKDRWQAAKLELRNVKATSMLFTSSISVDADWLPASSDGLINDTSIAAFQTSIDDLLQAARSKEPSSVLPTARAVVQACQKVDNDVQAIPPSRLASLPLSEQDLVNSLKIKINATLSNLLTACKNHATGYGVSPVSLLDAAASHLAATVVELVRILKIRRTTGPSSSSSGRGGALDPSSAFGMRAAAAREPMPPLREDVGAGSRLSQGGLDDAHSSLQGLSISVPSVETTPTPTSPAPPPPPAKEQPPQQPQPSSQQQQQSRSRISGGVSSIFGSGGSVKSALGAIGLGSDRGTKRHSGGSVRSRSDAGTLAGASAGARSSVAESFSQPQQPSYGSDAHGPSRPGYNGVGGAGSRDSYGGRQSLESDGSGYGARGQQPQQAYGGGYDGQHQQQYGGPQDEPQPYHHGGYPAQGSSQQYNAYGDEQRRDEYGERAYDDGADGEMQQGQERDPEELRAYIENQTEAIVHSIQSLLSAIRSGAQSSELQENLTQIITIVSSIVAISQEALPRTLTPAEEDEGSAILQDLTTHCDQLSEMQSADHAAPGAFNKQTKQAMAAASFGVAKSLKQLNALLSSAAGDEP